MIRSNEERIAVLEEQNVVTKEELGEIQDSLKEITSCLTLINTKLAKQQSFWAGVTFLAAIVGVLTRSGWDYMQRVFQQ